MLEGRPVPTQGFAQEIIFDGFAGLLIRSYATGASQTDLNIILWQWNGDGCILAAAAVVPDAIGPLGVVDAKRRQVGHRLHLVSATA